jgi:hypothetical protein
MRLLAAQAHPCHQPDVFVDGPVSCNLADAQNQIPIMGKRKSSRRLHYSTVEFSISEALGSDELSVTLGAVTTTSGSGERYTDLAEIRNSLEKSTAI